MASSTCIVLSPVAVGAAMPTDLRSGLVALAAVASRQHPRTPGEVGRHVGDWLAGRGWRGHQQGAHGRPPSSARRGRWIAETQAERKRALEEFAKTTPSPASPLRLTPDEIRALIDDLGDLVITLKDAEPDDKFEVYRALQLKLIYEPETETVRAYVDLDQHRGVLVRVRGRTQTRSTRSDSRTRC
jgi:hypothetical protein